MNLLNQFKDLFADLGNHTEDKSIAMNKYIKNPYVRFLRERGKLNFWILKLSDH